MSLGMIFTIIILIGVWWQAPYFIFIFALLIAAKYNWNIIPSTWLGWSNKVPPLY